MSFIEQLLVGLSFGALLYLIAAGLTLNFGLMGAVNLAHGSLFVLGGYIAVDAATLLSGGPTNTTVLGATVVAVVVVGLVGVALDALLLKRLRGEFLAQVVATIGVALIIRDLLITRYGGVPLTMPHPPFLSGSLTLFGASLPKVRWFLIALGVVVAIATEVVLARTTIGLQIRAAVDDRDMARAFGVPVDRLFRWSFGVGASLAAFAGVLAGFVSHVEPNNDFAILILALAIVILGGMGSIRGAAVAAVLVGVINQLGIRWLPELADFVLFIPVIAILALRPSGLFGTRVTVR